MKWERTYKAPEKEGQYVCVLNGGRELTVLNFSNNLSEIDEALPALPGFWYDDPYLGVCEEIHVRVWLDGVPELPKEEEHATD